MNMKKSHFIFALLLLGAWAATAGAHAFLDHADPKVGSHVSQSPSEVKAWFTQQLEPDFSSLTVLDAKGNQVDKKDSRLDDKDKTLLIVSLPPLPDGQYTVKWHVVSVDTHHTQGDFKFTIKGGG
jgi:copper resistance protein C